MSKIGKGPRNDAFAKVTGQAKYVDDMKVHGMLHAVPVYTSFVHAEIHDIDMAKALRQEGIVRIITAEDIPGSQTYGQVERDHRLLASKKIRYHGDVVAVVVSTDRESARNAATLIHINGQSIEAVFDPELASQPGSPLVHPEKGTNIVNHHKIRLGNIDKGFENSKLVLESTFTTPWVEHAYLEPESCLCIPRPDGVMEIYGSMQHPFSTRRFVAALLGAKLADIEVKTVPVGGGFGGKDDTAAIVCARTALAAKITGFPVKMTYEREWSVRESYKRHPYRMHYKMGFDGNGRLRAAKIKMIADAGAYCSVTPWVTWRSTVQCCGPYRVENVHCDTYGVYTNNVFTGAMRGFGSPQVNFAVEQMMDMAADRLGIGPVEIRRLNAVKQGSTTITGQTLDTHTVSMDMVLDKVAGASDFQNKLKTCSKGKGTPLYGIGLAMCYRGMSLGAEGKDFSSAIVNIQFDGSILLEVAVHENGQGSETAMIVLLANCLGVKSERIRYRTPSTSNIPDGGNTVSSRGTLMGGSALIEAARKIKGKMRSVVAPLLGCSPENIVFENEELRDSRQNGKRMGFDEAVHTMFLSQEYPYGFGSFRAPNVSWNEESGQGNAYFTWVYGAQVAEVEIDPKSGKVSLRNAYAAHDVGRAIHLPALLGQFYGGMAMGAGFALTEAIESQEGIITTLNFDSYRIPRAKDLPDMHAIVVENPDPISLSGAKGIGEPTNELMAAAIANAVANATGQRYTSLPIKTRSMDENKSK